MRPLLLVFILALASPAAAQVRYTDTDGIVHFVDSLDQVPRAYRPGAAGTPTPLVRPTPSGINWDERWREHEARQERERAASARIGNMLIDDALRRAGEEDQVRAQQAAAVAAQDAQRRADQAVRTAMDVCLSRIRFKTLNPKLDAFSPFPGYVQLRGTWNEQYHFDKCMAEEIAGR